MPHASLPSVRALWYERLMVDGTGVGEDCIFLKTHPAGHFYSPIPEMREVLADADRVFPKSPPREFPGIQMHGDRQVALMEELAPLAGFEMEKEAGGGDRFYATNGWFTPLDCRVLVGMMRKFQPKRIVEVGSGYSTAAMLDACERHQLDTEIIAIEPYADRLREALAKKPSKQLDLLEKRVQDVPFEVFEQLESQDILFIDSSHVSKVGSDLNHLVFEVLPRLKPGVIVHFHDILYPFEYPRDWVERGFAWNEAYLLRAFLQFNTEWDILLYNSFLTEFYRDRLIELYDGAASSGGLWLRRGARA